MSRRSLKVRNGLSSPWLNLEILHVSYRILLDVLLMVMVWMNKGCAAAILLRSRSLLGVFSWSSLLPAFFFMDDLMQM